MLRIVGPFCLGLALVGCVDPPPDHPGARGLSMVGADQGAPDGDAAGPDFDAGPDGDAAPVDTASRFIVLNDITTGLGIGATFGSDLDAVTFVCPDGREGAGVHAEGVQTGAAIEFDVDPAVGPPDGPCEALFECAAHVGPGGWLAVQVQSGDLSGCTVRMYEVADGGDDRFEAYVCETAQLNASCAGPVFMGSDGDVAEGIVR